MNNHWTLDNPMASFVQLSSGGFALGGLLKTGYVHIHPHIPKSVLHICGPFVITVFDLIIVQYI